MSKINPDFAEEIKKYGAKDFDACYNCGNCTAICELTEKNANFPRIFIRHGLLGQTDEILKSKELWLCYACNECSSNCPRQAGPGDYMAAMRRYAIASYDPTGLTKLIFKSNPISILLTLLLSIILGSFLLTIKPEMAISRWLFESISYEVIHNLGIIIFSLTGISIIWGLIVMTLKLNKTLSKDNKKFSFYKSMVFVINEIVTMKRYRKCDEEENSYWLLKPVILRPWFIHWSIMWGFLGLLLATILDFMFKDPATSIWLPSRILGTVAGILLVYGTTIAGIYRVKKITRAYCETRLSDWMFLSFLWIAGITGFWLEIAVAFDWNAMLNHVVFLLHTIISMELVLLFAFSKFAHAIYRPLALFFYSNNK